MSAATPIARGRAPLCACGCGDRTSTVRTLYIRGHRPTQDPSIRFWAKVDRRDASACWLWTGAVARNGYAIFQPSRSGPKLMAHRFAYQDLVGPIPDGLTIDHLCSNRRCMNPAHMEPVTRGENARRGEGWVASSRVRRDRAQASCAAGHPRTPAHARREGSHWRCKTCRREKRAAGVWK